MAPAMNGSQQRCPQRGMSFEKHLAVDQREVQRRHFEVPVAVGELLLDVLSAVLEELCQDGAVSVGCRNVHRASAVRHRCEWIGARLEQSLPKRTAVKWEMNGQTDRGTGGKRARKEQRHGHWRLCLRGRTSAALRHPPRAAMWRGVRPQ